MNAPFGSDATTASTKAARKAAARAEAARAATARIAAERAAQSDDVGDGSRRPPPEHRVTTAAPDPEIDGGASASTEGRDLATGGAALGIAMIIANAGNYLLNVFLGRWLTPAEFADANLMVTIMLLVTAVAISLQLIAARFAGINAVKSDGDANVALGGWLERRAVVSGVAVAAVLIVGASFWADFFNSASAWPFVILGAGMPFYLVQAVGRGLLQGTLLLRPLATTFVVEMLVRVIVGVGLVAVGFGVVGATIGLTTSFIATWFHVRILSSRHHGRSTLGVNRRTLGDETRADLVSYAGPVALLLLGQIIINNGDVLMAKRFLEPDTAGVYAAIALVGRAVFFLSWSVATTLFPAAAQRQERGEGADNLLYSGLAIVGLMGVGFVGGAYLLGGAVLGRVFGPEFADVSSPLARYAFATSLFAMANLIVSHHLATGRMQEAVVLLGGSAVQTTLLYFGRSTIDSLIQAQVIAMALLLVAVGASHVIGTRRRAIPSPSLEPESAS